MPMATIDTNDPRSATDHVHGLPAKNIAPAKATEAAIKKPGALENASSSDVTAKARDWTSPILRFLSNASSETLGACVVGLGATTYLVLGRVGLVLIGIVVGVVIHAAWEGSNQGDNDGGTASEAWTRREKGIDVVQRLLTRREKGNAIGEASQVVGQPTVASETKPLDFSGFRPETKEALEGFSDAVIRDYVRYWYQPILPYDSSFPFACRQTLNAFFIAISSHLSRKRPADTFLDFLTNSSSIVIVFLSELSSALTASRGSEPQDAVNQFLEENPGGSLANVMEEIQQDKKFKAVADDVLLSFVDSKAYTCEPVRSFLREVLAGLILEPTVVSCSRPEFINEWIIYTLEDGETTELVQAIDKGVSSSTTNGAITNSIQQTEGPEVISETKIEHKRTIGRAEDAMEEAMQEANRLSELIAAEDSKKGQPSENTSSSGDGTATGITPTSSQSDLLEIANNSSTQLTGDDPGPGNTHELLSSGVSHGFKSFDQIISSQQPTALRVNLSAPQPSEVPPLTLYNASISIFDDSMPGERGTIRSKPSVEYLLQIEPATSQYPGWMIARKYSDFETLHEVLRRISVVSGVAAFVERHQTLPGWKNKIKASLRTDLEQYLRDALSFQRLAESEGMKRFLERDQHNDRSPSAGNKSGFGFPSPAAFETMGKGMLDVLASAPKGAAGGGKAILGGVTGVLGGVGSLGQRKPVSRTQTGREFPSTDASTPAFLQMSSSDTASMSVVNGRDSQESRHPPSNPLQETPQSSLANSEGPTQPPPLPLRRDHEASRKEHSTMGENGGPLETHAPLENVARGQVPFQRVESEQTDLHLPPPPSEIPDDYNISQPSPRTSLSDSATLRTSTSTAPTAHTPTKSLSSVRQEPPQPTKRPAPTPLTIQETSVAVELFFATINELYSLSSAWTLRLTLLNAAKGFLLRPGNPNLEAIRQLLQSTIIDANTSDAGIATHIKKTRENALPTEEELKAWPPPPSEEEKEKMRKKARKLIVEKGMPQALTSVMGAAASGEALGKVFDCLQVREVARGLVFALLLQGIRAVTQ